MCCCLIAVSANAQFEGLRPFETMRELAPKAPAVRGAPALEIPEYRCGRVLDACTGKPVPGARLELWTEEIDPRFGGFHRVGEVVSGPDGRYGVRQNDGVYGAGEKARITAAGYLIRSATAGSIYGRQWVFPVAAEEPVPAIRVVDTFGRPIAGARITSTLSCAHDLPAFEVHTGSDGVAELRGFGLQDEVPDLRVRAAGYVAIKYLDADDILFRAVAAEPWAVQLPRARPFALRLLRNTGEPAGLDVAYLLDADGYHVERCDADGLVRFPHRYGSGAVSVHFLGGGDSSFVGEVDPPSGFVPVIRAVSEDWPADTPCGRVRIESANAEVGASEAIPVRAFHEDGWTLQAETTVGGDIEFPAGKVRLLVGGPFAGWDLQTFEFELAEDGTHTERVHLSREPKVRVEIVGAGENATLPHVWVESGVGETRLFVPIDEEFSVPNAPLVAGFDSWSGDTKRVPAIEDGMVIQLRAPVDSVRDPLGTESVERPDTELATQRVRFVSAPNGLPMAGKFSRDGATFDSDTGIYEFSGRAGLPWLAEFVAEGHVPIYVRGRFGPADEVVVREVPSFAKLELPGRGESFEVLRDDGLDFDQLAPGPLQLVLQWRDGRRKGLSLVLGPGEHRRILVDG